MELCNKSGHVMWDIPIIRPLGSKSVERQIKWPLVYRQDNNFKDIKADRAHFGNMRPSLYSNASTFEGLHLLLRVDLDMKR